MPIANLKQWACAGLITFFLPACTITDYAGLPGHRTHGEAAIEDNDISFAGFGPMLDGTFVHSTKYNNRQWQKPWFSPKVKLYTYNNPVVNSYPARPNVNPDGGSYENIRGFSGGEFSLHWHATDTDPNSFGYLNNLDKRFPLNEAGNWVAPAIVVTLIGPADEVDSIDWDLQSNVKNASQLFTSLILNGGDLDQLSMDVVSITLNDEKVDVDHYPLQFSIRDYSKLGLTINNSDALQSLLKKVVKNTTHMQSTSLTLTFSNKMEVTLPSNIAIAFNHHVLNSIIQK